MRLSRAVNFHHYDKGWHPTATLGTFGAAAAAAHLIGLDVVLDIMETLYQGFDDPKFRPSPLLKQLCHAGYLGRKKGRGFFDYSAA